MLALINPNLAATMSFYRNAIPMRYSIHPEPGLMLVWPGYLRHMVHPHLGRRAPGLDLVQHPQRPLPLAPVSRTRTTRVARARVLAHRTAHRARTTGCP